MVTTINISLPEDLLKKAKFASKKFGYSSLSEFIRDVLRHRIYPDIPGINIRDSKKMS